jgi:hypothetical protein
LSSFETDLSRFGLEMKKLWPKRIEKGLFVKILCFQGPICKFSRAWDCNLGFLQGLECDLGFQGPF